MTTWTSLWKLMAEAMTVGVWSLGQRKLVYSTINSGCMVSHMFSRISSTIQWIYTHIYSYCLQITMRDIVSFGLNKQMTVIKNQSGLFLEGRDQTTAVSNLWACTICLFATLYATDHDHTLHRNIHWCRSPIGVLFLALLWESDI